MAAAVSVLNPKLRQLPIRNKRQKCPTVSPRVYSSTDHLISPAGSYTFSHFRDPCGAVPPTQNQMRISVQRSGPGSGVGQWSLVKQGERTSPALTPCQRQHQHRAEVKINANTVNVSQELREFGVTHKTQRQGGSMLAPGFIGVATTRPGAGAGVGAAIFKFITAQTEML